MEAVMEPRIRPGGSSSIGHGHHSKSGSMSETTNKSGGHRPGSAQDGSATGPGSPLDDDDDDAAYVTRPYKKRRRHTKTKDGCSTCKSRKIKCDEARPICKNCTRRRVECLYVLPQVPEAGGNEQDETQPQQLSLLRPRPGTEAPQVIHVIPRSRPSYRPTAPMLNGPRRAASGSGNGFDSASITPLISNLVNPTSAPLPPAARPSDACGGYRFVDITGQNSPPGVGPRVSCTLWEDGGTNCFEVEARGVRVARREDNDMINGTKLLDVTGMTPSQRNAILKKERVRYIVEVGPTHLKGAWIPYERALDLANDERITELLYPLFVHNVGVLLYHPVNQSPTKQDTTAATQDTAAATQDNATATQDTATAEQQKQDQSEWRSCTPPTPTIGQSLPIPSNQLSPVSKPAHPINLDSYISCSKRKKEYWRGLSKGTGDRADESNCSLEERPINAREPPTSEYLTESDRALRSDRPSTEKSTKLNNNPYELRNILTT